MTPEQLTKARKIAAISAPGYGIALLVAHIDAQAAEIELLYDALEMAVRRNKVAKQLMNDEQIEHCCKILRAAK